MTKFNEDLADLARRVAELIQIKADVVKNDNVKIGADSANAGTLVWRKS